MLSSQDMIRVVAAIIEDAGRVLICQRRGGPFAMKWEFPGGKMHRGETPRAALRRELREELLVEARIGRQIFRVRHRYSEMTSGVEITFFTARLPSRTHPFSVPRNMVFERIVWVKPANLARYDFLAADLPLIRKLAHGDLRPK
jgi:8-oxo-dGTP diphosphatase